MSKNCRFWLALKARRRRRRMKRKGCVVNPIHFVDDLRSSDLPKDDNGRTIPLPPAE